MTPNYLQQLTPAHVLPERTYAADVKCHMEDWILTLNTEDESPQATAQSAKRQIVANSRSNPIHKNSTLKERKLICVRIRISEREREG